MKVRQIHIKPLDVIIVCLLLIASFIPWGVSAMKTMNFQQVTYTAKLHVDNKEIKEFPLSKDTVFTYKDKDGDINILEVKDGKIRMNYANCSDQVCVRRGCISKGGETIVCLPHKMVIEVVASDGSREGSVVY